MTPPNTNSNHIIVVLFPPSGHSRINLYPRTVAFSRVLPDIQGVFGLLNRKHTPFHIFHIRIKSFHWADFIYLEGSRGTHFDLGQVKFLESPLSITRPTSRLSGLPQFLTEGHHRKTGLPGQPG